MKKSWSAPQLNSTSTRSLTRTCASPPYTMMHVPSNPVEEMAVFRTTISTLIDCHSMPDSVLNKDVVTCMMTPAEPPESTAHATAGCSTTTHAVEERRWLRRRRLRKLVVL